MPAKLPRIVVDIPKEVKADLERLAFLALSASLQYGLALIQEAVDRAKSQGRIPSNDRSQTNSDCDKE